MVSQALQGLSNPFTQPTSPGGTRKVGLVLEVPPLAATDTPWGNRKRGGAWLCNLGCLSPRCSWTTAPHARLAYSQRSVSECPTVLRCLLQMRRLKPMVAQPLTRVTAGESRQRQGWEQSPVFAASAHPTSDAVSSLQRGSEGEGPRLGAGDRALGIIISLLNSIHSAFHFFLMESIPISLY